MSVSPNASGFEKKLRNETDGAARKAGDAAGNEFSNSFGGGLKKLAAVAAAAFASLEVGRFIKGSIDAASNLNETISKSNTIFGDNAAEIESWASTAAKSMGQSKEQALGAAAQFGNMFQQLGIGGTQAATMSKQMVQLASDFASFHNADITEVLEAQSAAFRGEYDSVQKFVPTITAAAVEQKALALGLAGSTKELTAQDKAIAVQALLMEGAGAAVGDFARTSAGFANQQRIMSAQWDNLNAQIGQIFLPVVGQAAQVVTSRLLPAFIRFVEDVGPKVADKLGDVITFLSVDVPGAVRAMIAAFKDGGDDITSVGLAGKFEEIGNKLRDVVDLVNNNRAIFEPLIAGLTGLAGALVAVKAGATAVSLLSGGMSALGAVLPLIVTPVGAAAVAIGLLAAAAVVAYQKIPAFKEAVDSVAKAFKEGGFKAAVDEAGNQFGRLWEVVRPKLDAFFAAVGPWLRDHAPGILEGLKTGWLAFAEFMATEFWPFLAEKLGMLLGQLGGWIVGTALPWIGTQLQTWGQAFGDWVNTTALPWLTTQLPAILGRLAAWIRDEAWPVIVAKLIEWGKAFGDWVEKDAVPWLKAKLPIILDAIQEWMTGTVLPALGRFALNMAEELLKFAVVTAIRMPGELAKVAAQLAIWAAETAARIPGWVVGIGIAIVQGIISGFFSAIGLFNNLGSAARDAILGAFSGAWNWLYGKGQEIVQGLADGVRGAVGSVTSAVRGVVDQAIAAVPGVGGILSKIPGLASGGIVTRPTLAVVGEAGPEAVVPLEMFNQGVKFGLPASFAAQTSSVQPAGAAAGGVREVNQYFYNANVDANQAARELSWVLLTRGR